MPVQIQVKGPKNGVDFTLLGHEATPERVLFGSTEILVVTDVDNKPIYFVPMKQVRFIQPIAKTDRPVPRHVGSDARINVHIVGDSEGDFNLVCNRVDYKKQLESILANLVTAVGENRDQLNLSLVVPFENIRYIDANYLDVTAPVEQPEPAVATETPTEKVTEAPKGNQTNSPTFKHKPRKN